MTQVMMFVTVLGSIAGAILAFIALGFDSAPQQAAAAGVALCAAVIPYVIMRVFQLNAEERRASEAHKALLAVLAQSQTPKL